MKRKLLVVLAILAMACWAGAASADTLSFYNITNNTTDTGSAYSVDVTNGGVGSVLFTFKNAGAAGTSIDAVYFDDGTLIRLASVINMAGVEFVPDAVAKVQPKNLPGGESITPPFETHESFSADANSPSPSNGVNPGEQLGVIITLLEGKTLADTIAALANGDLRIGIHVQAIPPTGNSDSFVNNPVPIPPTALLLGSGLLGIIVLGRRRRHKA
jgi:hypothetical protein